MRKHFIALTVMLGFAIIAYGQSITPAGPVSFCGSGMLTVVGYSGTPTFQWKKNTIDIPGATSPTYTVTSSGNYTVVVGGSFTITVGPVVVTINPNPIAAFTFNNNNECSRTNIQFTSTITGGTAPFTYNWDFGDGNTSNAQNPSHAYVSLGCGSANFTAVLTVTDSKGCTSTLSHVVTVKQVPDVQLEDVDQFFPFSNCHNSPSAANPNYTLTVNNISPSTCISSYTLNWGDGSPTLTGLTNASFPLTHTYTQVGAFQLTITGASNTNIGCTGTKTYVVANQTNPAGGLGTLGATTNLCAPASVPFIISNWQNNSVGTTYNLNFGDGNSVTLPHPLNATGNDHAVNHTYTTSSCPTPTYTATLIVINACDSTPYTAGNIQIRIRPQAQFTVPPTACAGQSVCMINTSTLGQYGPTCVTATTYSWDFGDPSSGSANTSTAASPCHTFAAPGNYTISLSTTNPCGTTTYTQQICIAAPPTVSFGLSSNAVCAPATVTASNTSNISNSCNEATYNWSVTYASGFCGTTSGWTFANGTSASSVNPSFSFTEPGTYTITLSITNPCGTFNSSQNVTVKSKPVFSITGVANSCVPASINPSATVTNCGTGALSYAWIFPSGSPGTSTSLNPGPVTFNTSGTYNISLAVTNECGTTTATQPITVQNATVANAGPAQTQCGSTVTMAANTAVTGTGTWTGPAGTIVSPNLPTTTITGLNPGSHTFTWTISNGTCSSSSQVTITISAGPTIASAGTDIDLCLATTATLNANNPTTGTGVWTQVAGPAATIVNPNTANTSVTGLAAGTYRFRWTISYLNCSPSFDEVEIHVYNDPTTAAAGSDQVICSATPTMAANIAAAGTGTWTILSGPVGATITSPNSPTSTITGLIPGIYILRWRITNGNCPPSDDQVQLTVTNIPTTANAGIDQSLCAVTSATLAANTATSGTGDWSFVSGPAGSNITNPANANSTVTGLVTGTYIFRWTISNGSCPPSVDDVQIIVSANATIANAGLAQVLCGTTVTMAGNAATVGTGSWTQLTGSPVNIITPSSPSTSITGFTPGVYTFQWTITNGACSSTSPVTITISSGPTAASAGPDQDLCAVTSTSLAANAPTTGNGQWSQVSGPAATITTPTSNTSTVTGLAAGVYVFRWTIAFNNCTPSTDDITITVYANPTAAAAGTDQVICASSVTLAGNTATIGTGLWSIVSGPGGTITNPATPNTTVTGLGVGTYIFSWTISNGACAATQDFVQVTVTDIPTTANAGNDQELCAVSSATLNGNPALSGTGVWSQVSGPAATITNTTIPNTTITGLVPGAYVFRWTIGNGVCPSNFDEVQLTVYENATVATAGPAQVICGVTATMAANTPVTGTGVWTQTAGAPATIVSPALPATVINGLAPGAYTFQWTITNGACSSSSTVNITISSGPTASNAGPDQDLCLATSATVAANTPTTGNGQWTQVTGAAATITNPTSVNTTVTGLAVGVYTFRWTISFSNCVPSTDEVTITVYDNPTTSNAGVDQDICLPTTTLTGNLPTIGSGQWSQLTGPATATIASSNTAITSITGLVPGVYTFAWTISNGPCPPSQDVVQVTYSTLSNNMISGASSVCINNAPPTITGSTPTGSVGTYNYQWQSSIDGGAIWTDIAGAVNINFNPPALVVSTCYRRLVATALCAGPQGSPSNALCITVNPDARALFTASSTLLCAPVSLDTIITLTTFPLQNQQYNWYNNNVLIPGTTNGLPPAYIMTSPGQTADIKLVTTSPFGCKPDSMSLTFNTRPGVTADFVKDTASGCGPLTVNFTNTSSILNSTIEFYWDFGNGNTLSNVMQPPSPVVYASSTQFTDTVYYITLKAFSGCDTTYKRDSIRVFANPKARFIADAIGCSPFPDTIINNSLGHDAFTTYYWDFGDGTLDTTYTLGTLYHTYITGIIDTFPIRLIMQNRCSRDTQVLDVVVSPSYMVGQVAVNGSELFGCAPHTVNFQNNSTGAAVLYWDFGDGSPIEAVPNSQPVISHTYLSGGDFTVHITLENYCSDTTIEKHITVYDRPVASFTLSPMVICTGNSVTTNNTSLNANSFEWIWGDATTTAGLNATHVYPVAGTYSVRLIARKLNAFGVACTDTSAPVQVVVVDRIPAVVDIDPGTSPCAPYTIMVSAAGAAAASQVDWYFYDSHTAPGIFHVQGPTASYIYNVDGVDSVKLVVTNAAGCKDSTVKMFTVYKTPKVIFTPINIKTCNTDTTATFGITVDYTGTDPLNYEWFVNGIASGNSNPFTHRFQAPTGVTAINIFKIQVLVTNSFGCGDTTTLGNFIIQTLGSRHIVVSPSLVQEQPNYTFSFTDTSVVLPSSTYLWYTGDRNQQTLPGKDITYTYGDTGIYKVKLLVQDYETGCFSTDSVQVYILAVPGYLYVPNAFCPGCHKAELRQFLPLGKGLKDYRLTIFNTWGQKVFETTSLDANGVPNKGWDGNWSNGQNIQQDAFSWYIEAHFVNGTEWKGMLDPRSKRLEKKGFVTIIR